MPDQSIALVGGDIAVGYGTVANGAPQSAELSAAGGHIQLASAASPGEVLTNSLGQTTEPAVNGLSTFGNIALSHGASLDTSAETAGRIVIRAGQFTMDGASIKAISEGGERSPGKAASPQYRLQQSLSPS